jgi:hypothetical protein
MAVTRNDSDYGGKLIAGTANLASVYSWEVTPNIYPELFKKYGLQTSRLLLEMGGRTFPVRGNYPYQAHEEDNRLHRTVTVGTTNVSGSWSGQGTAVSPLTNTITLSTDDLILDDDDDPAGYYIREGQSAWIKQSDGSMPEFYVKEVIDNGSDPPEIVLESFKVDTAEAVSAGDEIILGNINYGEDSGQPEAVHSQEFVHSFYPFESKETIDLTADVMAQEYWFEKQIGGYPSIYNQHFLQTEGRLNIHEDLKAWMGQTNDNLVKGTGRNSTEPTIHSAEGFFQKIVRLGGSISSYDFAVQLLDQIETYWESYHVTSKSGVAYGGSGFGRALNQAGFDLVQQYSMSDIMRNPGGDVSEVKANIKAIQWGDMLIAFQPLTIFNDPTMFGGVFNNTAVLIPNETVRDGLSSKERGNIGLGYEAHGDVNRKRVVGFYPGMSGRKSGGQVSHQYTSDQVYFASKLVPFLMAVNQMIVIRLKGE